MFKRHAVGLGFISYQLWKRSGFLRPFMLGQILLVTKDFPPVKDKIHTWLGKEQTITERKE